MPDQEEVHPMELIHENEREIRFECPICGRIAVYNKRSRRLKVHGGRNVQHIGVTLSGIGISFGGGEWPARGKKDLTGSEDDPYLQVFKDYLNG